MRANCQVSDRCECDGDVSLAVCSCGLGDRCSVCGHDADAVSATEPSWLIEIVGFSRASASSRGSVVAARHVLRG
jgi:hypothetical protein